MTSTPNHSAESNSENSRCPRQEQRVVSAFRVEVCGLNRYGRFFTERTVTSNVSDGGCQLRLRVEVERNSVVALRVIEHQHDREIDSRPVLFQVERIEPQTHGWTLGVSKLQPVPVWCVEATDTISLAPAF